MIPHSFAHGAAPAGNGKLLRVLMVEDSENDALLIQRALTRGGYQVKSARVDTRGAMELAMEKQEWDLILADHSMPQFNAPEALEVVKRHGRDVPFIIVSGHIEEETAVAAMMSGAHDYIMKDNLARLAPAVERELREAEVRRLRAEFEQALLRSQEELEQRVKQRTADLEAAYLELRTLMAERRRLEHELLEIAENERRRIGFDLHDDLGQKMTGLLMLAKALDNRLKQDKHRMADTAEQICTLVEEMMQHTHDLAKQFSAVDVQGDEICGMLKDLAVKAQRMFGIECEFILTGSAPVLSSEVVAQLYKIAQEAVSNGVKHGKASRVEIHMACEAKDVELVVQNDGEPYTPPQGAHGRLGLKIMSYRANMVGATVEIHGREHGGAVVRCRLGGKRPSKADAHAPAKLVRS